MDRLTKKQRSYNMSMIRSKNTKPELVLFKAMKKAGIKFKKHYKITGKPDAVLLKEKIAIFIDGTFWHGKNFKNNKDKLPIYWQDKISNNIKRDRKNRKLLRNKGWLIIKFWDDDVIKKTEIVMNKIIKNIKLC